MLERMLEVHFLPEGISACVMPGENVHVAAVRAGIVLEGACGGAGTCGKCLVQVLEGDYVTNEEVRLSIEQRQQKMVFACQTQVLSPMLVQVPAKSRITVNQKLQDKKQPKDYGLVVDFRRYTLGGGLVELPSGIQVAWESVDNLAAAQTLVEENILDSALRSMRFLQSKLCNSIGIEPTRITLRAACGAPAELRNYFDVNLSTQAVVTELLGGQDDTLFLDLSTDTVLWTIKGGLQNLAIPDTVMEGVGLRCCTRVGPGAIDWVQIGQSNLEVAMATQGKHRPVGLSGVGLLSCIRQMLATGIIDEWGKFNDLSHQRFMDTENGREWVLAWGWQTAVGRAISLTEQELHQCFVSFAAIGKVVQEALASFPSTRSVKVLLASNIGETLTVDLVQSVGIVPRLAGVECIKLGNPFIQKLTNLLVDKFD